MHTNRTPMTMGNRERAQREEKLYEKADFDEKDPRRGGGNGDLVRSHHREARSGFAENCGTVPLSYMEQREQVG